MKIYKKTVILALIFIMFYMPACSSNNNTDSNPGGLSKVWAVTSEHIETNFDSKVSHASVVSLDMKLRSIKSSTKKIAFGSFESNTLGLRIFTKKAAEKWIRGGVIPLMIVSDRSAFKRQLVSIILHKSNGKVLHPKWSWLPLDSSEENKYWWLVMPIISGNNGYVRIKLRKKIKNRRGYFSSFKVSVPHDAMVKKLSGCIRFPSNMHFSTQIGIDMHIHLLKQKGGRAYGFCYKNDAYKKNTTGNGHFVAVSTADGWSDVATSMRVAYRHAESIQHKSLMKIVDKINHPGTSSHGKDAIDRARYWVVHNIRYSVTHSLLNAPHTFDYILKNKSGVCTDLVLVLTMLLRKANVEAHPALTSATFRDAFKHNAADLTKIDHMVVYLPKKKVYLDPDKIHPGALLIHTNRQLLDIVTGKVVAVPEAPFPMK